VCFAFITVQGVDAFVNPLYAYALYARIMGGAEEADRLVNAALAACRGALDAIRGLRPGRQRIDAAHEYSERLRGYADEAAGVRNDDALRIWEAEGMSLSQLGKLAHVTKSRAEQIVKRYEDQKKEATAEREVPVAQQVAQVPAHEVPAPLPDPNAPLRPSIVAAIVTSKRGVLIERRHDGRPLYTFPAGEAEPGESPADTAIRETKEECELQIVVSHVIGERNHPKTGRHMIYLAARPYQGTAVHNGDEAELAEVRWVDLPEAEELLVGMYEPVHEHLQATLGDGH
jgi:8-oxo-dGTP diphosphatase